MPKTIAEKAAEKLYRESLEKKRDQANTIETIHQILNGRFHSVIQNIQEKEHQVMAKSKGKFFGQLPDH